MTSTTPIPTDLSGANSPAGRAGIFPKIPDGTDPQIDEMRSVFSQFQAAIYEYRYSVRIEVGTLVGGVPTDTNITEGWIRTNLGVTSKEAVAEAVEQIMEAKRLAGTPITAEQAVQEAADQRNLSGFLRDFDTPIAKNMQQLACTKGVKVLQRDGQTVKHRVFTPEEAKQRFGELYILGHHVKAMLKECASIALSTGLIDKARWGQTAKGMQGFFAEHMFIPQEKIYLGATEPDAVKQSFVHTWRGSGIKLEEQVKNAVVEFDIWADFDFNARVENFWAILFTIAEKNGLGASRSQGYGRFVTQRFERIPVTAEVTLPRSTGEAKKPAARGRKAAAAAEVESAEHEGAA